MRVVATELPAMSFLVRFHPDDGPSYDRMIVAVLEDAGRTIHLMGWIGSPLSISDWREAKRQLFPDAIFIRWERLRRDGTFSYRSLTIKD